jgi:hypothetical protein
MASIESSSSDPPVGAGLGGGAREPTTSRLGTANFGFRVGFPSGSLPPSLPRIWDLVTP